MIIHFAPLHLRVLTLVRDRQVTWSADTGPFGGFNPANGTLFPPSDLVALYELRNAGFITVDKLAGRVAITAAGMARLTPQRPRRPTNLAAPRCATRVDRAALNL